MDRVTIYQGDTPTFNFTVTQDSAAMDLENATLRFSAKARYASESFQFDHDDDEDSKASNGTCAFILNADDADTVGLYYAELQVITAGGAIYTVVQFELEIREQIGAPAA